MTKNLLVKAQELLERINNNPKIQDKDYLDRDTLRKELEPFELGLTNKTTRKEMVYRLSCFVKEQKAIADEIAYGNLEPVPAPAPEEKRAKIHELAYKLIEEAQNNEKNGYGYTISAFKLQAIILKIDTGLEKLEGHTITEQEQAVITKVHEWLVKRGHIKPVLYTVKENYYTRVYTADYPGRKESKKYRYLTTEQAAAEGLNLDKETSYLFLYELKQ